MEQRQFLNNAIELALSSVQVWEVNEAFGWTALNGYFSELAMLQAGVPFAELGISKRREKSLPQIVTPHAALVGARNLQRNDAIPRGSTALLKLQGVMRSQDGLSSYGMDTFTGWLRDAYENPNIDSIIIESESGGGESIAGAKLQVAISERNKPVISWSHMEASAAYRGLVGVDEKIASGEAAEFGSLGTFIPIDKTVLQEYRERYQFIYSTQTPEKNGGQRALIDGDSSKLQDYIDQLTTQFHNEVKNARRLTGSAANIGKTLSGAMFSANEAKQRGLIDSIGNFQYAMKRAKKMTK